MGSHEPEMYIILSRIATAGDGIILGVGIAALAVRTWFKFRSHSTALKLVEGTPQVSVHDLRSLIENDGSASPDSSSNEPLVVVRGSIGTENRNKEALTTENAADMAVFIERTQTYLYNEWRGIFGWGADWNLFRWGTLREQVSVSKRKVPFVLFESGSKSDGRNDYVHVDIDHAQHDLPLVTVYHKLHPVQASSSTFLQAVFGRRYPVGFIDEEKILPVGKLVTAVGVLNRKPDGQPIVRSCSYMPVFLTECTREQLILEMDTTTEVLFWTGVVLSSLAVGVLGYAFYKNWLKWKEWRRLKRLMELEARRRLEVVDDPPEDASEVPDGELCIVCLLRRRRAAFVSCGHRVCCMTCAGRIHININARCPVCRHPVTDYIRIYDS